MNKGTTPQSDGPARILMYTAHFAPNYSGAALQALTLAHALRARGHHIEFITNRWPGLADDDVVEGFVVRRLEMGRGQKHRELRLWFNMARYVGSRRRDFDILHSHGAYFSNAFIGPLARVLGLRSVVKASLARDDLLDLRRGLVGVMHRYMLSYVDACMAISRDLVAEFSEGDVRPDRIHHLPNGVDTNRFAPVGAAQKSALRATLQLPPDRAILVYVGVLDQRKNILWLVEQWLAHAGFGTGALLLAVGPQAREDPDGVLRHRLAHLADGHPELFRLHDFNADVACYYQCADLLILPSAREGLPNVVLEAMASGLPCVAARASGSRELIVEGETGHTYRPDDVNEMASAVRACLSIQNTRMGASGRRLAQEKFSIAAIADQYAAHYARLAGTKKRILFVENGIGYGGAIICLRHLVRNLDRRRFEPMVVTGLGDDRYQAIAAEASWKHIPDRSVDVFNMKRDLQAARWTNYLPGSQWLINQILSRLDDVVNFVPSLLRHGWTIWRFRPDLIHTNNEPLCNRAAILAGKLMGVPVVSHVRGDQQGSFMMQPMFRMPDYFIAVSKWVSAGIGDLGVPAHRRTFIYDGIELDKLNLDADGAGFRRLHNIPQGVLVVGLVGMLIPWKGQQLFVEAAKLLTRTMPGAVFAIVGGTPDEFAHFELALRQLVQQLGLDKSVVFTGHVSDMAAVYNGLDLVVSASTSPEPLGTMIIEAMTMARPIIAPAHGGALEMIDHEQTGLLFGAGDAQALADTILRLDRDPTLRARLGNAARAKALQRFAISEHVRQVQQVYDGLLQSPAN